MQLNKSVNNRQTDLGKYGDFRLLYVSVDRILIYWKEFRQFEQYPKITWTTSLHPSQFGFTEMA